MQTSAPSFADSATASSVALPRALPARTQLGGPAAGGCGARSAANDTAVGGAQPDDQPVLEQVALPPRHRDRLAARGDVCRATGSRCVHARDLRGAARRRALPDVDHQALRSALDRIGQVLEAAPRAGQAHDQATAGVREANSQSVRASRQRAPLAARARSIGTTARPSNASGSLATISPGATRVAAHADHDAHVGRCSPIRRAVAVLAAPADAGMRPRSRSRRSGRRSNPAG